MSKDLVHVVHVTEAFGGGIQTAVAQYIENSPGAKHTIIARSRPGHNVGEMSQLASVELLTAGNSGLEFLARAPRMARQARPDVVHLHSSVAGVLRLHPNLRGTHIVYTPHCYAFERLDQPTYRRWLYRWFESLCGITRHTIAGVSEYEVSVARTISARASFALLPNVIPTASDVGRAVPASGRSIVLSVGRICAQKGPEVFADAYRAFQRVGGPNDVEWVWAGDGDPELRAELKSAGVTVTGWLSNATVRALLHRASLYVHTARWEGSPIAPLEASALGVPVFMQRTRTTAGLGYLTFDGPDEVGVAAVRYFSDDDYRQGLRSFERARTEKLGPEVQAASLMRIYGIGCR